MNRIEGNAAESAGAFRLLVFSTRREAIRTLEHQTRRSDSRYGSQVLEAVMRFSDTSEHLPPGVTEETFHFLCATASLKERLWEQLAQQDQRIPDLLIQFYLVGATVDDLAGRTGLSRGRISQLIAQGRAFLWEGAPEYPTPEFPYEKARDFAPERLRRGHVGRTVESSRSAAIVRWHDETNGGRRKLLAGIQRGNAKRSQWAKDRYHDPVRGQATRDNLRRGPEVRRKKNIHDERA